MQYRGLVSHQHLLLMGMEVVWRVLILWMLVSVGCKYHSFK